MRRSSVCSPWLTAKSSRFPENERLARRGTKSVCVLLLSLLWAISSYGYPQAAQIGRPLSASVSSARSFSELTAAVSDPADATCARAAAGAVVSDPIAVSSTSGVLELTFNYQTAVDDNGLKRYCYVYTDGSGATHESPTLQVNPGDQLIIHFNNNLPTVSATDAPGHMHAMKMAAIPQTAPTSTSSDCSATTLDSASTNLHFHGTNVAPVCGQDEVVHTVIPAQSSFTYTVNIPANEPPGVYWYHPHPHGYSEGQVLGGATGVILVEGIQNVNPTVAGLPQRVFVLRDQALPAAEAGESGAPQTDLSINFVPILYPTYTPATVQTGPSEKEFWRVLNTSADTMMDVEVLDHGVAQSLQIISVDGVPLTDASGNPTTMTVTDYAMSPASRIEFIVTTPALGDTTAQLVTETWNNGATGDYDPGRTLANIVAVSGTTSPTTNVSRLPAHTASQKVTRFAGLAAVTPAAERTLYFSVKPDFSEFYITLDGQTPTPFSMDGPPNLTVTEGTVEQWTIENRSTMDHNFHIHQLHFQTLAVNGATVADPTLRDTVNIPHWSGNASDPYPSVTLMMDFRNPNIVGTFVYHCHILSHEDRGMMGMIQVLQGATTTALDVSPASASAGSSVTLTATVAPSAGSGTPTGTVTFLKGATTLGTGTLNSSGVATLNLTNLAIGSNSITASYAGDTSFATSTSSAQVVTVTAAVTTTTLSASESTVTPGANVTFTATVTAPAGTGTPAGTVTFLNGATTLGTATLNGSGAATYKTSSLAVGSASITATYAGNSSFTASTSTAVDVTVQLAATTTALTASPTAAHVGDSVTLSATVSGTASGSGTPTGTVTFLNGSTTLGTGTLSSAGVATYVTTALPSGIASITASYGGDTDFSASISPAVPVTVSLVSTTTALTVSPTTAIYGATVTCTATVTGASGSTPPAGTVTFALAGKVIATETLSSGSASYSTTKIPVGSGSLTATYFGTSSYATSTSTPVTVTVTAVPTTTTLTASPTSAISGASVSFTAAVAVAAGSGTPTGTVNFSNGSTLLGSAALDSSGTATYSTTALPIGSASVTAAYLGANPFAASTSTPVTVAVSAPPPPDFSVTANPASGSVSAGGNATTTLSVTPANGFNSAVSFACSGLPSESSCSFNPATITPTGTAAVTTTVTITTTAAMSTLVSPFHSPGAPLLALVLPGLGALFGIGRWSRRQPNGVRWFTVALLGLFLALGIGACGSSSTTPKNPGTPAGTSTVTVTATAGTDSHTATYTLTVAQ